MLAPLPLLLGDPHEQDRWPVVNSTFTSSSEGRGLTRTCEAPFACRLLVTVLRRVESGGASGRLIVKVEPFPSPPLSALIVPP